MSRGFDPAWLAARAPFDEAALDRRAVAILQSWFAGRSEPSRALVVDLGSGTGAALRRLAGWLPAERLAAFAVERDPAMLAAADWGPVRTTALLGDSLEPLEALGGPPDGQVDLVLAHALADVVPLGRLAERVAALLRPGGLAHLALSYDGQTQLSPVADPALEERLLAAYHRHMDRRRASEPDYGGSTAGRRLPAALQAAGLEVLAVGPAWWDTALVEDRAARAALLEGMLEFVVSSVRELGEPEPLVRRWEVERRAALAAGRLALRVRHLDVLARRP